MNDPFEKGSWFFKFYGQRFIKCRYLIEFLDDMICIEKDSRCVKVGDAGEASTSFKGVDKCASDDFEVEIERAFCVDGALGFFGVKITYRKPSIEGFSEFEPFRYGLSEARDHKRPPSRLNYSIHNSVSLNMMACQTKKMNFLAFPVRS